MAEKKQDPTSPIRHLRQQMQHGKAVFLGQYRRLRQNWHSLSKGQKYMAAAAVLLFVWTLVLQVQVLSLSQTVALQRVRISQLEKQAQKQNNQLYSASVTLADIEKKWHALNFRVLENTWRIEEPKKNPDSL